MLNFENKYKKYKTKYLTTLVSHRGGSRDIIYEKSVINFVCVDLDKTFYPSYFEAGTVDFDFHYIKNIKSFQKFHDGVNYFSFPITGNSLLMAQQKFLKDKLTHIKKTSILPNNIENYTIDNMILDLTKYPGLYTGGAVVRNGKDLICSYSLNKLKLNGGTNENILHTLFNDPQFIELLPKIGITIFGLNNKNEDFITSINGSNKELNKKHTTHLLVDDILSSEIDKSDIVNHNIVMFVIICGATPTDDSKKLETKIRDILNKIQSEPYEYDNSEYPDYPIKVSKPLNIITLTTPTHELDITVGNVNKGESLKRFLSYFNKRLPESSMKYTLSNVAVFGDSENDVDMFTCTDQDVKVGLKVAMPHYAGKNLGQLSDMIEYVAPVINSLILLR